MKLMGGFLDSLSELNRDNLRKGKFNPSGKASDPTPIDESVLSRIPAFRPDESLSVDPVPARQVQ